MKAENNKKLKEKKNWILLLFKETGKAALSTESFMLRSGNACPARLDLTDGTAAGSVFQIHVDIGIKAGRCRAGTVDFE